MRRSRTAIDRSWPAWRYGPNGEKAVFPCEAGVPMGWTKKPGEIMEPFAPRVSEVLDRDALIEALLDKDIDIGPTWGVAHMKKVLDS